MPPFVICKIDYMHKLVFVSVFFHNIKVNFYALIFATRGAIKKKKNYNGSIFFTIHVFGLQKKNVNMIIMIYSIANRRILDYPSDHSF